MLLRRYTRTKDGKTHTYYALVESLRAAAGPRQHVVAYLGELNHDQGKVVWQRTVGHLQSPAVIPSSPPPLPDDDQVSAPDDPGRRTLIRLGQGSALDQWPALR